MSEHTPSAPTTPHTAEHGGHGVAQEPDDVPVGQVFKIGLWGVLITVLCIWLSGIFLRNDLAEVPAPAAHTERLDAESKGLGIIELGLFWARGERPDGAAQKLKAAKEAELRSYGWIDEKAGIIHIPIERAYDRVVDGYGQKK
jgi:hypothetical protein